MMRFALVVVLAAGCTRTVVRYQPQAPGCALQPARAYVPPTPFVAPPPPGTEPPR